MQRLLFTVGKALGIIFGLEKYLQMESKPGIKPENNFRIKFIESPRQGKIY